MVMYENKKYIKIGEKDDSVLFRETFTTFLIIFSAVLYISLIK